MDHSQIDLKAYALGEATAAERSAAEAWLADSPEAREELERLQLTMTALHSLREEEIPRRIAFVSDPVFAPSLWQRFWNSGPRLGFAGAGLLAAAILVHGFVMQPQPVEPVVSVAQVSQVDIDQAVRSAVADAVKAVEVRYEAKVREEVGLAVAATEKRFNQELQLMSATMQENEMVLRKQMNRLYVANAGLSIGVAQE